MTPVNSDLLKVQGPVSPVSPVDQWNQVFETLFENNPTPMLLVAPESWAVCDVNAAAEKLYGRSRLDLLRLNVKDLCADEMTFRSIQERGVEPRCSRHIGHGGQKLHLKVSVQNFQFSGRSLLLLTLTDMSAQMRAEAAYDEVQRKYKNIFENAVEGFYINIPGGRFLEVNPAFAKMLGYESPEQLVAEITDIANQLYVNPAQRKVFQDLLTRRGFVRCVEFQAKRRDGEVIWLSVSARAVKDESGALQYYEGLAEDVTERKLADARLREMNETLEGHARQLERSNADLQQFAYAVSHDLKEPLRLISSYLTLLSLRHQELLNTEGKDFLSVALSGSRKMKGLIEDLLVYSMIGSTEQLCEDVDARDILEDVIETLRPQIQESKAIITLGQVPVVRGVRVQIEEVFRHLIQNSIKFRREGVELQISVQAFRKDDHWLFQVRDNSMGVEVRSLNRIFHIFQKGHAKESYSGNGIGLALCKKIIEMHGGRIWMESNLGEGSVCQFTIPLFRK